jgi:ABC-type branched-subunit amino acid transport system permease subunit
MTEHPWTRVLKDLSLAGVVGSACFWVLLGWPVAKRQFGPMGWLWLLAALVVVVWAPVWGMFVNHRRGS